MQLATLLLINPTLSKSQAQTFVAYTHRAASRVAQMQCPAPGAFVRLSADNRRFELDEAPFFFTGCNSYYLMTRAAESSLRQQVLEVLDDAKAAGVRVIRTWAFNDGQEWNALQPAPGLSGQGMMNASPQCLL